MVISKIIAVILIVLSLFITDVVFSKMYQRKVAKNSLQVTVVRMCRKNIPDDLIVHWLGIKIELAWSILSSAKENEEDMKIEDKVGVFEKNCIQVV